MPDKKGFEEIARQLEEHMTAVKGTIELAEASVAEDERHDLLVRSLERMDAIEKLTREMLAALKNCFERIESFRK